MNKLIMLMLLCLTGCGFKNADEFWNHRIEGAPGNGDAVCVMWAGTYSIPFPCGKPREEEPKEKGDDQ